MNGVVPMGMVPHLNSLRGARSMNKTIMPTAEAILRITSRGIGVMLVSSRR